MSPQPSGLLGRHAEQGPAVELVTWYHGKAAMSLGPDLHVFLALIGARRRVEDRSRARFHGRLPVDLDDQQKEPCCPRDRTSPTASTRRWPPSGMTTRSSPVGPLGPGHAITRYEAARLHTATPGPLVNLDEHLWEEVFRETCQNNSFESSVSKHDFRTTFTA